MDSATVFFIDSQKLAGHDNPWGVRYDSQVLPMGSVVVGFMRTRVSSGGAWVQEVIDRPYLAPNQVSSWIETLDSARAALLGSSAHGEYDHLGDYEDLGEEVTVYAVYDNIDADEIPAAYCLSEEWAQELVKRGRYLSEYTVIRMKKADWARISYNPEVNEEVQ